MEMNRTKNNLNIWVNISNGKEQKIWTIRLPDIKVSIIWKENSDQDSWFLYCDECRLENYNLRLSIREDIDHVHKKALTVVLYKLSEISRQSFQSTMN